MLPFGIDPASVIVGIVIGIPVGIIIRDYYHRTKNEKTSKVITHLIAFAFTVYWVIWHWQAAQGIMTDVPRLVDIMGGISLGLTLGFDGERILKFISEIVESFTGGKK